MIKSFANRETKLSFETGKSFPFQSVAKAAIRKLTQLDTVTQLSDLAIPPGNQLEALSKDREGYHSIRIKDQFRVCFKWKDDGAYDVEIVDYH